MPGHYVTQLTISWGRFDQEGTEAWIATLDEEMQVSARKYIQALRTATIRRDDSRNQVTS